MNAPEIVYRFTWSWPDDPQTEFRALVNHAASIDLARVLEARGALVSRTAHPLSTPGPGGRQTAAQDSQGPRHG